MGVGWQCGKVYYVEDDGSAQHPGQGVGANPQGFIYCAANGNAVSWLQFAATLFISLGLLLLR